MTLFERALIFAAEKHSGMTRKLDGAPYILHPMEVALIVSGLTDDEEALAAALLHDTVEDTGTDISEIEELFGPRVAELVASETEDKMPHMPKSASWLTRKRRSLEELEKASDPAVKYIWLGDKLSNMRSLYRVWRKRGNEVFSMFNQRDPAMHAYYYREIDRLLACLKGSDAAKEYHRLVETVFKGLPDNEI